MSRRNDDYPIIRKKRSEFFPHRGNRNSERHWNDHTNPLNIRRHHGTDPLKDGFDPQENPIRRVGPRTKKSNIPI
jgi:hypothetical protein